MDYAELKKVKTKAEIRIEIAQAIREGRLLAGLTILQMADCIGCSVTQYNFYDAGMKKIKPLLLRQIIEALRLHLTPAQFDAVGLNQYSSQAGLASTLAAYSENCFGEKINEEALNAIAHNVHNELLAELTRDNPKPSAAIIES